MFLLLGRSLSQTAGVENHAGDPTRQRPQTSQNRPYVRAPLNSRNGRVSVDVRSCSPVPARAQRAVVDFSQNSIHQKSGMARIWHGFGTSWARNGHSEFVCSSGDDCPSKHFYQGVCVERRMPQIGIVPKWHENPMRHYLKLLFLFCLARLRRFERPTPAFGGQYSIQLSYRRIVSHCMT